MNRRKLKCIMLFKDEHGLGHLPFFRYICNNLSQKYHISLLVYSDIDFVEFGDVEILRIPKEIASRIYDKQRSSYLQNTLKKINPDIFLVDYFPFGRFGSQIDISLVEWYIHKNGGKVISFMRDIYYGHTYLKEKKYGQFLKHLKVQKKEGVTGFVVHNITLLYEIMGRFVIPDIFFAQLYLDYVFQAKSIDAILIFGDVHIFDIRDEFLLNNDEKNKFHHVGYIPDEYADRKIKLKTKKKVLVASGGNITSREDFLALLHFLRTKKDFEIEVLLGPYVDEYLQRDIEAVVIGTHMKLRSFVKDFVQLLDTSDYFFGFGGYGTFQHLFTYQGKAYIMANYNLSNFRHRYYEQKNRTKLFEKFLNIHFLDDFSEEHLEKCLEPYQSVAPDISGVNFCDEGVLHKLVEKIYHSN